MDFMSGLISKLTDAGLAKHASVIRDLARPAIRVDAHKCDLGELSLGASRFGGEPDLPYGFEWPLYRDRPLSFLAQIELSSLPVNSELPHEGCLAFFYEIDSMQWGFDPADRGCSRVAFFETPTSSLKRTKSPPNAEVFKPCALSFTPQVDLPDSWDFVFEHVFAELGDAEREAYSEVVASHPEKYHHLLGHAQLIQNDMRVECHLASNGINVGTPDGYREGEAMRGGAIDWELLFQIDTDDGPGWMWGDVGRIYFWLRKQDVLARRFENSWLVLQCT